MGSYGADKTIDINELKENLKQTEGVTGADNITELPAKVTVDGYEVNIDENGKVTVAGGTLNQPESNIAVPGEIVTGDKNKEYTKNGTAVIPVEFAIVPGLDNVEEGLVISDIANDTENQGNQFVWIPVADETPYRRNTSYEDTRVSSKAIDYTEYLPEGITDEETAVRNAKGFYISRYEAGKEEANTLVSKKGVNIWTNIPQVSAKETAKTMYTSNTHVKSALISGIQWDMTMLFISSKPRVDGTNKTYDVTKVDSSRHVGSSVTIAGNNEADRVCNIYDLEGNAWEYVAEKNTYSSKYPFVARGGRYFTNYSASGRNDTDGSNSFNHSFRLVLYVR